jgi:hypothetical protein
MVDKDFKTVGEAAQVSRAWLYQQEDLKERILHLRAQERPRASLRRDRISPCRTSHMRRARRPCGVRTQAAGTSYHNGKAQCSHYDT